MQLKRMSLRGGTPKIGGVFQEVPHDVEAAWIAHRYYIGRRILKKEIDDCIDTRMDLMRAVRKHLGVKGWFAMDGYLIGHRGIDEDPKFTVIPDHCPTLNREEHDPSWVL